MGISIQGKKLTSAAKVCAALIDAFGWQIYSTDSHKFILLQYKLFGVKVKKTANEDRKIAKIDVILYIVYKLPKK